MKPNTGMRCHDLCPKMKMGKLPAQVRKHDIRQIQLALKKSISGHDFTIGHYSSEFIRVITRELEENQIHVAILGCYINPISPIESRRQVETAYFTEHMRYARVIGADIVGTETGRLDLDSRVTEGSYAGDAYRLLLKSMREIVATIERLGIIAGMEGVFSHTLYSPARMERFLGDIDSPNAEVIPDAVSLIHSHQVEPEAQRQVTDRAFACYGGRIGAFHVKDPTFDGQEQLLRRMGDGLFRYEPLTKCVRERKPRIAMLLEDSNRERCHEDAKLLQQIYDQVQRTIQGQPIRDNRL